MQNAAIYIFDMTGKTIKKLPVSSGMESVSRGMDRRDRFLIPLSIKDNDFRYYNIK